MAYRISFGILLQRRIMSASRLWKQLWAIAAPIALQNLILSSINLVDVFMISRLGDIFIAGAGIANQIYFLFVLTLFGINSGGAIFIAQFWGRRDESNIYRTIGLALLLSQGAALLFFAFAFFAPERLIALYSPDPAVISAGASYLKTVSWSYFVTALSFTFSMALRAVAKPLASLYASVACLLVNIFLNYVLIFGHFGFPALGLPGAALATLAARMVESALLLLFIRWKQIPVLAPARALFSLTRPFITRVLAISLPVMLNEILWSLGVTLYHVIYARMGTTAIASIQVENSVERLAFVFFIGIGAATATLIGHSIGRGDLEETKGLGFKLSRFSFLLGLGLGTILALSASLIFSLFDITSEVRDNAVLLLRLYGVILPFRAFNVTNVVGVFRGGGDTRYCLFVDLAALWIVGLPMAALAAFLLHLPLPVVFMGAGLEELAKSWVAFRRLRSGKWIHSLSSDS